MDKITHNPGSDKSSVLDEEALQERVRARTRELALIAGRNSWEVSQRDYEQAKRELMGKVADDPVATDGLAP